MMDFMITYAKQYEHGYTICGNEARMMLTAILTDGHYDISSEDCFALKSILTTLDVPSQ
jgi:hypothetical protein